MKATLILIPLLVLALAGIFYSNILGDSSRDGVVKGDLTVAASNAGELVAAKLSGVSHDYGKVQFSEAELRDVVLVGLETHSGGRKLLEHASGFGARVVDNKVELRVLINVSRMREGLSQQERELFDRAVATSRMAEEFDVDLLLEGVLSTGGGSLRMSPNDTTLKLSLLKLDLDTWAERIGYKRRDVERLLRFKLPGYRVTDARVSEGGVELAIRKL